MYRSRLQQAPPHCVSSPWPSSHPTVLSPAQDTRSFCGVSYPFLFILSPHCSQSDHSLKRHLSIVLKTLTGHRSSFPNVLRSVWSDPMFFLHPTLLLPTIVKPFGPLCPSDTHTCSALKTWPHSFLRLNTALPFDPPSCLADSGSTLSWNVTSSSSLSLSRLAQH